MMKRGLVSILFVSLLLVVNSTAISENAQISGKDSNKRYFVEEGREISSINKFGYSVKESKSLKGKIIYVPDDYSTIQKAVDHAQPGDTIIVRDGTYVENVVINKPHLTIKSENGPENCIVEARSDDDPVFLICSNYTTLIGFTIMDGQFGIRLLHSSNNIITNNSILNNGWIGLWLWYSSDNIIPNNNISNNGGYGVRLDASSNNQITNNTFIKDGVSIWYSYQNIIEGNTVNGKPLVYLEGETGVRIEDAGQVILVNCSDIEVKNLNLSNTDIGIELWDSENCRIESNVISNNGCGIEFWYSSNNIIANNTVSNNKDDGIELDDSSNNIIMNNTISNNKDDGIELWHSSRDTITNNTISDNRWCGIWLDESRGNTITKNNIDNNERGIFLWDSFGNRIAKNNFIRNPIQATFEDSLFNWWFNNYWDDWKFSLPRPIKGTISLEFIDRDIPWINFDWHPSTEPLEG